MSGGAKVNLIKQDMRLKQFIGWFIVCMLPFATRGIMDITKVPLLAALLYWLFSGIIMRFMLEKQLPYFSSGFSKIKKEILFVIIVTSVALYFYIINISAIESSLRDLILNFIFFAFLKGCLEPLVMVNIYDSAGCRIKAIGFLAAYIYEVLIFLLFWSKFVPMPEIDVLFYILLQAVAFVIPIITYERTKNLLLWSFQHIIYNLLIIYFSGFGINMFIRI